ncbi:mycofactocin biosynthesis glycosyltransferase MftF [Desulfuromonas thiophila]|uniref:mycofactocin biosynthesis glycosyltransferase MftF n=1 Tax=Desulfuromonas thiophila TaxID=57664 RepID=UPI0029F5A07E|nr:mycofactocin biosynthesis glycosyltransferase MftF [Desulfuromonas thiophila]
MIWRLADGIRLEENVRGAVLVSRRPLRMLRLNSALLALVRQLPVVNTCQLTPAQVKALELLAGKGFVERSWQGLEDLPAPPCVSIIIPVKDRAEDLRQCLTSLQQLNYPADKLEVLVVDDGSSDATPDVARQLGAHLLHSGAVGGGPALARNKGAAIACGDILAFIDSDCSAHPDWLQDLLPVFADPEVAAVGGWVDGMFLGSALDRYEAVMSSLNLGRREMSGGHGDDTFYLPSCNLLIRRSAFVDAGGFRTELHVGEDVDLTWRLRDNGWNIKYLPRGTVYHAHRSFLWPFMKRRFDYGTSEGILHRLHPVRGKKMVLPPMLTAILFLLVGILVSGFAWLLVPVLALLIVDMLRSRRRMLKMEMPFSPAEILLARLRALGSLGYYIGYHLLRYYLVPLALVSLWLPQVAVLLAVLLCGVATVDFRVRKPRINLFQFCFFYTMEQLSYGLGVLRGCFGIGSVASYALDFKFVS